MDPRTGQSKTEFLPLAPREDPPLAPSKSDYEDWFRDDSRDDSRDEAEEWFGNGLGMPRARSPSRLGERHAAGGSYPVSTVGQGINVPRSVSPFGERFAAGGGGGGPPPPNEAIDALVRGVNALVQRNEADFESRQRKEQLDLKNRLDIKEKLGRIKANDASTLASEIDNFEKQLDKNGVKLWKHWYEYFETALDERAATWIENSQLTEPGKSTILAAREPRADDRAWAEVYRLARSELARKVNVVFESPGDSAQAAWNAVGKDDDYKAIETTIDKLTEARTKMYKALHP